MIRRFTSLVAATCLTLLAPLATAATGVCDATPEAPQKCIDAIQASGGVVNDIFRDTNGLTGDQLPLFGKLFNAWPGCPINTSTCGGQSNPPYDCPGQYTCAVVGNDLATAESFMNTLDRRWMQPLRIENHTIVNNCPAGFGTPIADGLGDHYNPWEGLVFDLGGPSNKVAIFAENDHGPQPCESTEYTVFLSDNPYAKDMILSPQTTGVDPQKWNRAVLSQIFTKGFVEIRPTDPTKAATCGDTPQYSVEEDSFVTVYALPCGITFRYASIVAGNDGLDFPDCQFHSNEGEIDAVAGLTESGSAVCPDADGDLYVDCGCMGSPMNCDCNDADPNIHPGAPEACDAGDVDCDGSPGTCKTDFTCYKSQCLIGCDNENAFCPVGSICENTPNSGKLCVPMGCAGGCPAGGACVDGVCVPACDTITCPGDLLCIQGACINACANIQCPMGQTCQEGKCISPCTCFAGDIGCGALPNKVCDLTSGECASPSCVGVKCAGNDTCDPATGMCVSFCNPNVKCPATQKCVEPIGCVPICDGVMCNAPQTCNPQNGLCEDHSCDGVMCFDPLVCVAGQCVDGSGGAGGNGGSSTGGKGGMGGAGGTAGGGGRDPGDEGTCSCRIVGESNTNVMPVVMAVGIALAMRRRQKRAR
jgi:hypothetical protein